MKKSCVVCKKWITNKDKHVLLATRSPSKSQESYFHFECFRRNYHKQVEAKARNIVQGVQKQAVGLLGGITGAVGDFQGKEQLQKMLNFDLSKEIPKIDLDIFKNEKEVEKKLPKLKPKKNGKKPKKK